MRKITTLAALGILLAAGCSSDDPSAAASEPTDTNEPTETDVPVDAGSALDPEQTMVVMSETWHNYSYTEQVENCAAITQTQLADALAAEFSDFPDWFDADAAVEFYIETCDTLPGTRDNPLPVEKPFDLGDWTIEFAAINPDAWDLVSAENQYNDPPERGHVFVMAQVNVTYIGDDSGHAQYDALGLLNTFVGADGNTYNDSCGVFPDDLKDVGDMFFDASASGNICVSVDATAVDGGTWIVKPNAERVFVSAE